MAIFLESSRLLPLPHTLFDLFEVVDGAASWCRKDVTTARVDAWKEVLHPLDSLSLELGFWGITGAEGLVKNSASFRVWVTVTFPRVTSSKSEARHTLRRRLMGS